MFGQGAGEEKPAGVLLGNMLIQGVDHYPRTRKSICEASRSRSSVVLSEPTPRIALSRTPGRLRDQYATIAVL
jgi:hypothetical protein